MVLGSGNSIASVAKNIGVHEMTLGKWVKKARDDGEDKDRPLDIDERAELERLRKELAHTKMQLEFAKMLRPGSRKTSNKICCDRGLG